MKFTIEGRLPSLNYYVNSCRTNRFAAAKMKKECEELITHYIKNSVMETYKEPVTIRFSWYEKNTRRDKDNIAFGKKFILDALQKTGVLENDNWHCVTGFVDEFFVDKDRPRIEVEISLIIPFSDIDE